MFFRFFIPSLVILAYQNYDFLSKQSTQVSSFCLEMAAKYSPGITPTFIFTIVPLVLSLMIDWKIIIKMFFGAKSKKDTVNWQAFIMLNWICSALFVLSLTHVLSFGGFKNLRHFALAPESNLENRLALILAFFSVTYLIAFFGVSLVMTDLDASRRNNNNKESLKFGLVSFVPPAYYLLVVAFVWQLDTSLFFRALVCITGTVFFFALTLSHQVKKNTLSTSSKSLDQHEKEGKSETARDAEVDVDSMKKTHSKVCQHHSGHSSNDAAKASCTARESENDQTTHLCDSANNVLYRLYPNCDMNVKWRNELFNDIVKYMIPTILVAYFVPFFIPFIHIVSFLMGTIIPLFDMITYYVYMTPAKPEDPVMIEKRLESYPYKGKVYTNGWFLLIDSKDLKSGESKFISANGRDYVVFRGQDNVVRCLDAYCVHLGANLGVESKVVDNCIECPFHKWRFDGEGKCVHIPYQESIPANAQIKAYHICEFYDMILVWNHTREEKPNYYPRPIKGLDEHKMIYRGEKSTIVNMHLNEFAENTSDFSHFGAIHSEMIIPFTLITIPGVRIKHVPGWKQDEDEPYIAYFLNHADLTIFGMEMPETAAKATITLTGPCSLVYFTFETPIGSVIIFEMHTPIEPLRMHTRFRWYADESMPRLLVWYIVGTWVSQWKNDISLWENKKFMTKPLLIKNDGPMHQQRRWFRQFYTPLIEPELEKEKSLNDNNINVNIDKVVSIKPVSASLDF